MRKTLAAFCLIALSALSLSSPGVAAAAPTAQPHYCSTLVGKAAPGKTSPVLAQGCSNVSQAEADKAMRSSTPQTLSAAASINIMIWYDLTYYGGYSNVIYGNAGDCDSSGYRVIPNAYWASHLSSIARQYSCNAAYVTNFDLNRSTTFFLSAPNLGYWSNNVGVIQVYSTLR